MAWCVNEVELIDLAVTCLVVESNGLRLNGDTALAFEVHRIEHLVLHLTIGQASAELNHSVCKRALSVIDVGNN